MPTSLNSLRCDAVRFFQAGVQAAAPEQAVLRHVHYQNNRLIIDTSPYASTAIHLIAIGKAAGRMMKAAQAIIPARYLKSSLVITDTPSPYSLPHTQVMLAGHPFPNQASLITTQTLLTQLQSLEKDALVILLLSGGASALLCCPANGITLADKVNTTQLLMQADATIAELNCVRKHLSCIKGGQLAQRISPHPLHTLIISDVADNDLSVIGSGLTYGDDSTFAEAIALLHEKNIWDKVPETVRIHLLKGHNGDIAETPSPSANCFHPVKNTLIADNHTSVTAAIEHAKKSGYGIIDYHYPLTRNCRIEAENLMQGLLKQQNSLPTKRCAIITGGETTVNVTGSGSGGRNQEMALAFALAAKKYQFDGRWVFLSAGTDGKDGPTDAAGGLVDCDSVDRITNAATLLANNDAYHALQQAGDLLLTGATGTNVADIQIVLLYNETKTNVLN